MISLRLPLKKSQILHHFSPNKEISLSLLFFSAIKQKSIHFIFFKEKRQRKSTRQSLLPPLTELRSSVAESKPSLSDSKALTTSSSSPSSLSLNSSNKGLSSFALRTKFPYIFLNTFRQSDNSEIAFVDSLSRLSNNSPS